MIEPTRPPVAPVPRSPRLLSLDAYRGLVMLAIASSALGIPAVAEHFKDNATWQAVAIQFEHTQWVGCSFWDLIQPSFMFLVGVSMAFSYAKRRAKGQSYGDMLEHAFIRSLILIGLAILLSSNWGRRTNFTFTNVLAQIGLGYTFLFLMWGRRRYEQFVVAIAILVAYWGLFAAYPTPAPGFRYAAAGLDSNWPHLSGFEQHWDKNTNAASAADVWLLNLFPREEKFAYNDGGYQTLNFAPSLATMIFGLMAGELLRGRRGKAAKFLLLVVSGIAGLAVGWGVANCFEIMRWTQIPQLVDAASQWGGDMAGVCPLVKRIWTPSWAIFSAGWTCLFMAGFYLLIDIIPLRWLAYPLIVVGANSITMYMMSQLLKPWARKTLAIHLGENYAAGFGEVYAPMVQAIAVMLIFWLICYWLYRQRVYLKI